MSARNFGLFIAYVIPGFTLLFGLGFVSPTVHGWLMGVGAEAPSVGGFLYALLGSVACGMAVSAVRWLVVDPVIHATGLRPPRLDYRKLPGKLEELELINEHHYHYFQHYSNMLVALAVTYPLWRASGSGGTAATDLAFLLIEFTFAAASRNALRHFYRRAQQLLGESEFPNDQRNRRRETRACAQGEQERTQGQDNVEEQVASEQGHVATSDTTVTVDPVDTKRVP